MSRLEVFNNGFLSSTASFETEQSGGFCSFDFSCTTTPSSDGYIEAGMNNTILVPSSIFTNSYFYKHQIEEGNGATNWPNLTFYSDDSSADNTTAHVSGIITGNTTGDEFLELLEELSKNTTGEIAYNYTFDDPTYMNLPADVLKLVPFSGYAIQYNTNAIVLIENSPTEDLAVSSKWSYNTVNFDIGSIIGGIINFAIEVGTVVWDFVKTVSDIVCSAITAIVTTFTEFLNQLGKALINFGKALVGAFETAMNAVKDAVNIVKRIIEELGNVVLAMIKEMLARILQPVIDAVSALGNELKEAMADGFSGTITAENLAKLIVTILVGSAVFIGIMTLIASLSIINTITNIVTGGGATILSQFGGSVAKMLIGFFVTMAATELAGITVDECLKQAEDATKGTFELGGFIKWFGFYLASKTRTLKSVQEVAPVGLGVALLGVIIFAAKKMVVTGTDKIEYFKALIFDAMSIILLVYAKTKFKNYPWVARWYKIMDIAQDVLEIVGLAGVVTETIEDIHGFITAG